MFVLTAIPAGTSVADSHAPRGGVNPRGVHRYVVMALDRRDGRVVWQHTAREEAPHEASHQDNGTWASASAMTDGQHVIASFESRGIYAYDMNGKLVWQKDLGDKSMRNEFGEGSTPVLYRNRLVVVWDHTKGSFITALDKNTGNELWRVSRDEIDTWATPYVVEHDGRAQVIVPGMNKLHSYDLETGEVVWHSQGLTMNPDSVAGGRGRHRHRDERIPRQQSEGHPHRRRERRSHGLEGDRLVARSRHALRAVARPLRRVPVSAEEQLADSVGVRREDRQAALSASAARRAVGSVFVAGRRRRARVHHRAATARRSCFATAARSRCSRRTCWTTGSTRRRRSSTAKCTCAAIDTFTVSGPSESRRHRHRRGARRVNHIHPHRSTRLSCAAVRARSVSTLSHRRVADSRDVLGAEAAQHAAEDAGQPLRQEVQRAVRELARPRVGAVLFLGQQAARVLADLAGRAQRVRQDDARQRARARRRRAGRRSRARSAVRRRSRGRREDSRSAEQRPRGLRESRGRRQRPDGDAAEPVQAADLGSRAQQRRDLDVLGERVPRHRPRRRRDAGDPDRRQAGLVLVHPAARQHRQHRRGGAVRASVQQESRKPREDLRGRSREELQASSSGLRTRSA